MRAYEDRFQDTFFLFPVTPMDCIRRLSDLSDGCLLVISADKGYTREADLQGRDELGIAVHGSFSVTVNYHALGEYVAKQGGVALHSSHHSDNLGVSPFVLGIGPDSIIETRQAYATAIEGFGPDDFYALKKGMEQIYDTLTTPQIISYLRLSGWDANILLGCTPTLLDRVDSLSEPERQDLSEAIRQVWEMYYPIGEEGDLPFHMGVLLYGMGYCADALTYFRRSLDLHGQDPSTLYNVGMSHYCLHQLEDALEYIDRALAIVPGAEEFRAMWDEIEQDIRRRKSTGPQ